jgi:hypothetical protein
VLMWPLVRPACMHAPLPGHLIDTFCQLGKGDSGTMYSSMLDNWQGTEALTVALAQC